MTTNKAIDYTYFERLIDETALQEDFPPNLAPAEQFTSDRYDERHSNETLFVQLGERYHVLRWLPPGAGADPLTISFGSIV